MDQFFRNLLVPIGLLFFRVRPIRIQTSLASSTRDATIWIDVTRTSQSNRMTGIERVTSTLSRQLLENAGRHTKWTVRFFRVTAFGSALEVPENWLAERGSKVPQRGGGRPCVFLPGHVVLQMDHSLPLNGLSAREVDTLKKRGVFVLTVVYDVLPISHPKLFPWRKKFIFREWLRSTLLADVLFFISRASEQEYVQLAARRSWETPGRRVVMPLGPLADRRPTTPKEISFDVNQHTVRLLSIGTLEPRKDYEGTLDAVELLWRRGYRVEFTIIGRLGWKCSKLLKRLQGYSQNGQNVTWRSDVDDDSLARIIKSHDFLVANSIGEGFGLPLVEAAALGLPVLARDISVFREILPEAIFYKGGSPALLASAIEIGMRGGASRVLPGRLSREGSWNQAASCVESLAEESFRLAGKTPGEKR